MNWQDNRPNKLIGELRDWRAKARQIEHDGLINTVTQLLRFGVCPCVAMGRYSTCCKPKHGPLNAYPN